MVEQEQWTAADEARLRTALATLRADVESVPLVDPRFVRARGARRRRQQVLSWTAAAAVAAVVAGSAGYAVWRPTSSQPVLPPAGTTQPLTTASTPSAPATSGSVLSRPGALPLAAEWSAALGLEGSARLTRVQPFEAVECLAAEPGTKVQQESVTAGTVQGGQVRFAIGSGQDAATAADGVADQVQGCAAGPGFQVDQPTATDAGRLYPYTAGDAGSGWLVVVPGPHDVVLLQVVEPDRRQSRFTADQVDRLATVAAERLVRYGTGTKPSGPATAPTTETGPRALDEQMPVTGPAPRPAASLFVAASQWASAGLTGGAATTAGQGALEGSTAVASCETDEQQAGVGGRVGVVSVRAAGGAAAYLGRQRVQVDEATDAASRRAYVQARLAEAKALWAAGCRFGNGTVKATPGPTQGTWRLDTVFADGSPTLTEWVGVTAQRTPGAVSTIVLTRASDPGTAFAELDRLLGLARQK